MELRSPDPSCNPYLALAVMLSAGLDGLEQKLTPPEPVTENIYEMSLAEREKRGINTLPGTLGEALDAMEKNPLMREVLGDHIFYRFMDAKRIESDIYRTQVHEWELEQYLATY